MSQRPADAPVDNVDKKKCKYLCLSVAQKVPPEKPDSSLSVKHLTEKYGAGMTRTNQRMDSELHVAVMSRRNKAQK